MRRLWKRLRDDAARHEGWADPALWPLLVYRLGQAAEGLPGPVRGVASKGYGMLGLGVELVTGTRLHRETRVGAAPHFIHGRNVRIHPDAVIGDRVGIMHDVTIGTRNDIEGAPIIEDDAFIGAGAKVLGPVRVGKGAIVAANSLVVTDVPPGATAMGVPARALPQRKKPRPG